MLIILFLVLHFNFLFVPCGRLSWLPVSFLLHVKRTHYRIVSYRIVSYRINERIGYKRLSLAYKVLTTSQLPSYLNNLISVQPPRSTRSSSVVTLSRPPTISSLKITRSFRYASPRLWNQLPDSFRQPHQSRLDSPPHSLVSSSLLSSPLSSSINPSLFHSRLKTYLFNKSFPP